MTILLTLLIASLAGAAPTTGRETFCARPDSGELVTDRNEWTVMPDLKVIQQKFIELYDSGKRIQARAYWDADRETFVFPKAGSAPLAISAEFIKNLSGQIATALDHGYADFLFYPDLGHVHLLTNQKDTEELGTITDPRRRFEMMLEKSGLVFLYHTAELFKLREGRWFDGPLVPDPWLQWRYYSRNFVGANTDEHVNVVFAKNEKYNTVRSIEGYTQKETIYFSASKDGCFPVKLNDRTIYFDVSAR